MGHKRMITSQVSGEWDPGNPGTGYQVKVLDFTQETIQKQVIVK